MSFAVENQIFEGNKSELFHSKDNLGLHFISSENDRNLKSSVKFNDTKSKPLTQKFLFNSEMDPQAKLAGFNHHSDLTQLNQSFTLGKNPKLKSSPSHQANLSQKGKNFGEEEDNLDNNQSPTSLKLIGYSKPISLRQSISAYNNYDIVNDQQISSRHDNFSVVLRQKEFKIEELQRKLMELNKTKGQYEINSHQNKKENEEKESIIDALQNQINQFSTQLMQTQIEYQKKIHILKQDKQDHPDIIKENISQNQENYPIIEKQPQMMPATLSKRLTDKDQEIITLRKKVKNLENYQHKLKKSFGDETDDIRANDNPNPNNSVLAKTVYDNYIGKLERDVQILKMKLDINSEQEVIGSFIEMLNMIGNSKAIIYVQYYQLIKAIKKEIFTKNVGGILESIDKLLEKIDNLSIHNEEDSVSQEFLEHIVENCVYISSACSHNNLARNNWKELDQKILEIEKEILQQLLDIKKSDKSEDKNELHGFKIIQDDLQESHQKGLSAKLIDQTTIDNNKAEIILSEFSDEDFEIDDQEEKNAIESIKSIKVTIQENMYKFQNINDYIKYFINTFPNEKLPEKDKITPEQLAKLLQHFGLQSNVDYTIPLILRLNCDYGGALKLQWFFDSIKSKNNLWWKNKLHNNSFDLKYKSINLAPILNQEFHPLRNSLFLNVNQKLTAYKESSELHDSEQIEEFFRGLFDYDIDFITKKQFRKLIINRNLPFNRLETLLIIYLLGEPKTLKISYQALLELFITCDLIPFYMIYKERELYKRKIKSGVVDKKSLNNNKQKLNIVISRLKQITLNNEPLFTKIKDSFKLKDSRFSGYLTYNQFYSSIVECDLPINLNDELTILFDHFAINDDNTIGKMSLANKKFPYQKLLDMLTSNAYLTKSSSLVNKDELLDISQIDDSLNEQSRASINELKLQEAYNKIKELEEYIARHINISSEQNQISSAIDDPNKENNSILANNISANNSAIDLPSSQGLNARKPSNYSHSPAIIKGIAESKKNDLFSTERTLKLKVEDLDYENARLRKLFEQQENKIKELTNETTLKKDNESQPHIIQSHNGSMIDRNFINHNMSKLESKLDNLEKNSILKEMELRNELNFLAQVKTEEITLLHKNFEVERNESKNMIEAKNQEINEYRAELEAILAEMEYIRRQTQRG